MATMWTGKGGQKPKVEDFLPGFGANKKLKQTEKAMTGEEVKQTLQVIARAFKTNGPEKPKPKPPIGAKAPKRLGRRG